MTFEGDGPASRRPCVAVLAVPIRAGAARSASVVGMADHWRLRSICGDPACDCIRATEAAPPAPVQPDSGLRHKRSPRGNLRTRSSERARVAMASPDGPVDLGTPTPDDGWEASLKRDDHTPWGWSSDRLWRVSIAVALVVSVVDILLGSRIILIDLLIGVPCCALFTARWVQTARAGAVAVVLAVLLAIPDGIWGTPAQFALAGAVLMVALACTWAASVIEAVTR